MKCKEIFFTTPSNVRELSEMAEKNLELCVLYDIYGGMLTEKQREVFELYYSEDFSLAEIAEHTGTTRQGVRDSIKHAEAALTEMEEKLGAVRRARELRGTVLEIKELAQSVERVNRRDRPSAEITRLTQRIAALADELAD